MTATLTLLDRPGSVTVHDEGTVRAIADAVARYNRGNGDTGFRVRQSLSQHIRRSVVFRASQVAGLNAAGIDLVDPHPAAVAA